MEREINLGADEIGVGIDWLLQNIVLLSKHGVSIPVTVTTAAGLVTGDLINGARYMERLKELLTSGNQSDIRDTIGEVVDVWAEAYKPAEGEVSEKISTQFIHLDNAKLITGSATIPSNGMLWRAKLKDIIGFCPGQLSIN